MATEKKITSRIQQKHDVAANWAKATNFIPKKGEIIIYDAEYNASGEETQAVRFKIGDGSKTVNNLPFAAIDYSSDIETLEQKVANNSTAIGALQENTVPKTRKINNKALSSDITLGAADVGVNETAFPGLKKTGTVTGVKMNGTTKNPSSGVVDLGTVITAHQSLDGKQDKITSSNKLAASLVSGLATVATSGSYNDLSNIPVISQDLTASGFTPVANTYYKHTGTTTDLYTNGVIYFYNGTKYASLDGSGGGSTTVQGEAIVLANADWEKSGGYNIVPKKPLVDGYEGVLCFNLEVIPHPLEISWDNATAWGDIPNAVGVRLFSFTYEGETQDICFVEFPAGTEINNTVLTFSAYAIWLGTIIPLWADTEFWKAYGDGGSGGAISANGNGWVKNDGLPVYGNYMRYIVAVSITNIANQDIWGGYITGEPLWTKKPGWIFLCVTSPIPADSMNRCCTCS